MGSYTNLKSLLRELRASRLSTGIYCAPAAHVWVSTRGSVSADAGDEGAEVRDNEVRRIEREGLEARLGRGGYVVGAMWDEGNMVHAMRRFGGTTLEWRFGDG